MKAKRVIIGKSIMDVDSGLSWGGDTKYIPDEPLPENIFGVQSLRPWMGDEESWFLVEPEITSTVVVELNSPTHHEAVNCFVEKIGDDGWVKLVNLTPHKIFIYKDGKKFKTLWVDGDAARVETNTELVGGVNGIPVYKTSFGEVINLPEPEADTFYIVSRIVKSACPDRDDLLVPAETVRDSEGNIVGCRGLSL